MRTFILSMLLLFAAARPAQAQSLPHEIVYEGVSGYWTGEMEVRARPGHEAFMRIACDIRRSSDAAILIVHTFFYEKSRIREEMDILTYDRDSLLLRVADVEDGSPRVDRYTVQGLHKVRTPSPWVIRRTRTGGPPYIRITDVRQRDSLIIIEEESSDQSEWTSTRILRLTRRSAPEPAHFLLPGYERAKRVSVVGSFNDWREGVAPMRREKNGWVATLPLPPGEYQYKFWVDGHLVRSPFSSSLISDGSGGYNAILKVP